MSNLLGHRQRNGSGDCSDVITDIRQARKAIKRKQSTPELIGLMGAIANQYYGRLAQQSRWTLGSRKGAEPFNTLIRFCCGQLELQYLNALQDAGLDPWCGCFLGDRYNRPTLAAELSWALRPTVAEGFAIAAINRGQVTLKDFEEGAVMVEEAAARLRKSLSKRLDERVRYRFASTQEGAKMTYNEAIAAQVQEFIGFCGGQTFRPAWFG